MGKIIATANCPFDMQKWFREDIVLVWAGLDCIMALNAQGELLMQTVREGKQEVSRFPFSRKPAVQHVFDARRMPERNVWGVSLSKCRPRTGILQDREGYCVPFGDGLNRVQEVRFWQDVVQVECSDACFGLTADGRVLHANWEPGLDYYREANAWRDIARIVTGNQSSLFGITTDGRVLFTGNPYQTHLAEQLSKLRGVVDLYVTGSECGEIVYLTEDGTVHCLNQRAGDLTGIPMGQGQVFASHFWYSVLVKTGEGRLEVLLNEADSLDEVSCWPALGSFSLGSTGYEPPFAVGVIK